MQHCHIVQQRVPENMRTFSTNCHKASDAMRELACNYSKEYTHTHTHYEFIVLSAVTYVRHKTVAAAAALNLLPTTSTAIKQ